MFPSTAWETYKQVLAEGLSDADWDALSPFMHAVTRTGDVIRDATPGSPIAPEFLDNLREGLRLTHAAYVLLAGKPPPSLVRQP